MSDFDWIENIEPIPYMGERFIIDKDSIYEGVQPYKDSDGYTIITITGESEQSTEECRMLTYEGWQSNEGRVNEAANIEVSKLELFIQCGYMRPLPAPRQERFFLKL